MKLASGISSKMPRESRLSGKLPTHDNGEKRQLRHDACLKANADSGFAVMHISKRPSCRTNFCPRSCSSARCLPSPPLLSPVRAPGCTEDAPKAATSTANNADVLTPDQAKRALDTLQDDKKRAQMIDTLRAIANASPSGQNTSPEPKPASPLTADSLGAQLLLTVSEQVGEVSHEIAHLVRSLTHFPAFYYWFVRTANDPSAYKQFFDIAWKLALVFGCAFAAEWLMFRVIKRPVALLEARLPQSARAPAQTLAIVDPPSSAADVTAQSGLHRRRLSLARAWQSLVRLPFVLGRLALELLPVLAFVGVATCCWVPRSAISRPSGL